MTTSQVTWRLSRSIISGMKICRSCGQTKSFAEFYRSKAHPDGFRAKCKSCYNTVRRAGYEGERKAIIQARNLEWQNSNREALREGARSYHRELRLAVLTRYGQICACCGGADDLTIDHIAGNGRQHRLEIFGRDAAGYFFYEWLEAQGYPNGYQTLCRPCNISKADTPACRLRH